MSEEVNGESTEGGGARGYPRPQLERDSWQSLNGVWEFALDPDGLFAHPGEVSYARWILVPFAPETERSGIAETGFFRACWYRKVIPLPTLTRDECLLLHFGAVDHQATIFVDGVPVFSHLGGYTPFSVDLTPFARDKARLTLDVRAADAPDDLTKPRGKQDWLREPHAIWYPRTSGIWQTVWLERVPATRIECLEWTPNLERWEFGLEAEVSAPAGPPLRLRLRMLAGKMLLVDDTYLVVAGEVHRRIALSDPGIDDSRNALLWSPESPTLVRAELELIGEDGQVLDRVKSYAALRSVGVQGDRFVLNGRPYPLRLVLDQGYWPETGTTAPDDAALRRDVELAKSMGFNGVRKHQKIEDPRYLYWADQLGLLVWEEMPSAYRFTGRSIRMLCAEWVEVLRRDKSHPCIVAWVPFNESWGVPNLPDSPTERHYVRALYHLTHSMDGTRPVIGNDGWESVATDIIGIHDYDEDPERLAQRYFEPEGLPRLLRRERPGGRILVLEGDGGTAAPVMLTEFGGIALSKDPGAWGYSSCETPEELERRYTKLLGCVSQLPLLAGYCYTQFTDTYQEANGLLYADRTPKFPLSRMAKAAHPHGLFLAQTQTERPPP